MAEQPFGGGIECRHGAVVVESDHGVGDVIDDGADAQLAVAQAARHVGGDGQRAATGRVQPDDHHHEQKRDRHAGHEDHLRLAPHEPLVG